MTKNDVNNDSPFFCFSFKENDANQVFVLFSALAPKDLILFLWKDQSVVVCLVEATPAHLSMDTPPLHPGSL